MLQRLQQHCTRISLLLQLQLRMPVVTVGASALALTLTREAGAGHVEQRAIVKAARERLHPAVACLYHGDAGADGSSLELLRRCKRRAKVVRMWHAGPGWEPQQLEIRLSRPISRSSCQVERCWWDALVTREWDELCGHNRVNDVDDKLSQL